MDEGTRERAERRLAAAVQTAGAADPRPMLRERLRHLRERAPAAFDRALSFYEQHVLPALADGAADAAPLESWIEYARFVGALEGEGRTLAIDTIGRAADYDGAYRARSLVLHVPDDAAAPALVAIVPAEPSAPQRATLDLLVSGRLAL